MLLVLVVSVSVLLVLVLSQGIEDFEAFGMEQCKKTSYAKSNFESRPKYVRFNYPNYHDSLCNCNVATGATFFSSDTVPDCKISHFVAAKRQDCQM